MGIWRCKDFLKWPQLLYFVRRKPIFEWRISLAVRQKVSWKINIWIICFKWQTGFRDISRWIPSLMCQFNFLSTFANLYCQRKLSIRKSFYITFIDAHSNTIQISHNICFYFGSHRITTLYTKINLYSWTTWFLTKTCFLMCDEGFSFPSVVFCVVMIQFVDVTMGITHLENCQLPYPEANYKFSSF